MTIHRSAVLWLWEKHCETDSFRCVGCRIWVTATDIPYSTFTAPCRTTWEALSMLWDCLVYLQLIVGGVLKSCELGRRKRAVLVAGVGLAGVILSHTILGYVTTVLL